MGLKPETRYLLGLHIGLWLVLLLARLAFIALSGGPTPHIIFKLLGWAASGALLTAPLALLFSRLANPAVLAAVIFFGLLSAGFGWSFIQFRFGFGTMPPLRAAMAMGVWSALFLGAFLNRRAAELRRRHAAAQQQASEARLMALRHQINPHALFNSLNGIVGLVDEDPERAKEMLRNLSRMLRHLMSDEQIVTLGQELDLVHRYLELQQMRFEGAVRVQQEVRDAPLSLEVPAMVLYTLVENAMKHGSPATAEGTSPTVVVRIHLQGHRLSFEVSNPGSIGQNGTGMGLSNLKRRLDHMYPHSAFVELRDDNGMVTAVVRFDPRELEVWRAHRPDRRR